VFVCLCHSCIYCSFVYVAANGAISINNNHLVKQGEFVPIAVESHIPINRDALQFLSELVETTMDVRASSFLFQRISVAVQRFNFVLLHRGFVDDDRPE